MLKVDKNLRDTVLRMEQRMPHIKKTPEKLLPFCESSRSQLNGTNSKLQSESMWLWLLSKGIPEAK